MDERLRQPARASQRLLGWLNDQVRNSATAILIPFTHGEIFPRRPEGA
jgi:hypothetical protein